MKKIIFPILAGLVLYSCQGETEKFETTSTTSIYSLTIEKIFPNINFSKKPSEEELNLPLEKVVPRKFFESYRVKKGDTWSSLSKRTGRSIEYLMKQNNYDISNPNFLRENDIISLD